MHKNRIFAIFIFFLYPAVSFGGDVGANPPDPAPKKFSEQVYIEMVRTANSRYQNVASSAMNNLNSELRLAEESLKSLTHPSHKFKAIVLAAASELFGVLRSTREDGKREGVCWIWVRTITEAYEVYKLECEVYRVEYLAILRKANARRAIARNKFQDAVNASRDELESNLHEAWYIYGILRHKEHHH